MRAAHIELKIVRSSAMTEAKSQNLFKRALSIAALIGTVVAATATFSGNLISVLKNTREVFLNVTQGPKRVPFEIKTYQPKFVVLGTMSGEAYIEKPFVRIRVANSTLRTDRGPTASVSYIRLGLAYLKTTPATWDVAAWSEKKQIGQVVESFSTLSIPAFEVVIPIDGIKELDRHWLALEIGLNNGDTTYMHSGQLIFSR